MADSTDVTDPTPAAGQPELAAPTLGEFSPPDQLLINPGFRYQPLLDAMTVSDTVLRGLGSFAALKAYKELLRDDQVRSTWQQRARRLISCELIVEPGDDSALAKKAADTFRDEELATLDFDAITERALYGVFYGWNVSEIIWKVEGARVKFGQIITRERGRFRFGMSRQLYFLHPLQTLIPVPERKFWTLSAGEDNDDAPYGLGLAHSLYWPVFFKRNGIKFWLIFLEKFGMPTAVAKVPDGQIDDPKAIQKAITVLKAIATDAGVVVPTSMAVELLEAARSGTADYDTLRNAMNEAISKVVLSQTMTTDNGSSRSQAAVHNAVADDVVKGDNNLIYESFRRGPMTWWTEYNFGEGVSPPILRRSVEPPKDLVQTAQRDVFISQLGFEPTEEYITETYGDGWQKKAPPPALPAPGFPGGPGRPTGPNLPDAGGGSSEFAEGEYAALQAMRAAGRADQEALVEAAVHFAEQYETVTGKRVSAILNAAEHSGDYATMSRHLHELMAEVPPADTVEKVKRATVFSRLLGAFRSQRQAA
jgi:uncharacterized protein DUF935